LFTGQWADLPLEKLAKKASAWGYDGLELACWGDHFNPQRALTEPGYVAGIRGILERNNLEVFAISNHLVGQAVLDRIDERHQAILPEHVWGDGDPDGVNRRAVEEMKATARAARLLGVGVVNGFTGSSIWHLLYAFPPTPERMINAGFSLFADRWGDILETFQEQEVKFALEVHPTEIAFDFSTAERALDLVNAEWFGFNFDPSHLVWQGVDPVPFIREFRDNTFHVHMKDVEVSQEPRAGILGSHLSFGHPDRAWDFRSPGRGQVNFQGIIRALNDIDYRGPLSVEWEDPGMDREFGAKEAASFVRNLDFPISTRAFDSAFDR
jgi:sugar phosphate isomerase/epimerase